ncbi:hypothetical protein ACFYXF_03985 [Streptomyces sp. NPDC002680]|uniref:hypothetical protein n=1 Tax=Streptomyces sp. NPDC002680 TaxID=3364659 RepID=UPI0036AAE6E8
MIVRVAPLGDTASDALAEALGRPVCVEEKLTGHTVIAHWPGQVDYVASDRPDGTNIWTSDEWAERLDDLCWKWPATTDRHGSRDAIWHATVRLHPDDRAPTGPEWSEIAHRLARTAHLAVPGDGQGCRWFAIQAQPGRLDLLASLIREDGTWQKQPHILLRQLSDEARHIESDLRLLPVPTAECRSLRSPAADSPSSPPVVPNASVQFSTLLAQLSNEADGPLAAVRAVVEYTAQCLAMQSDFPGANRARHQLDWIARRLYGVQQDLDTAAADLAAAPHRAIPTTAPAVPQPSATPARSSSTP